MSELKGRFLVNNTLIFGSAWCLVMAQIQFSLIKKIKTGRQEQSLNPHSLRPITSHFCLTPSPSNWTSYLHHPLRLGYIFNNAAPTDKGCSVKEGHGFQGHIQNPNKHLKWRVLRKLFSKNAPS